MSMKVMSGKHLRSSFSVAPFLESNLEETCKDDKSTNFRLEKFNESQIKASRKKCLYIDITKSVSGEHRTFFLVALRLKRMARKLKYVKPMNCQHTLEEKRTKNEQSCIICCKQKNYDTSMSRNITCSRTENLFSQFYRYIFLRRIEIQFQSIDNLSGKWKADFSTLSDIFLRRTDRKINR